MSKKLESLNGKGAKKFNSASKKKEQTPKASKTKKMSDAEVKNKLHTYSRLAKKDKDKKGMEKRKKNYELEKNDRAKSRIERIQNFKKGREVGLHGNMTTDEYITMEQKNDQKHRDRTIAGARKQYNETYAMKKNFNNQVKQKEKTKGKAKTMKK